ncbi:MAG TPA: linear amide C-N hydrolase [Chitinophagaceae bacterium]|jgi:choloylglycine hydrolase|nr:linear amide C-N hydrolase [Chitinophagaceae bacterium]
MKKSVTFILIYFATIYTSSACTTFFINKNGQLVFGRNYDWVTGAGMVCTNLRGLQKTSMKAQDGKQISWISDYGSITFNQYGKEFPTGGMNEKGLVVELMWLDGSKYPAPDDRPAIGVLQWIQYQLDRSATVDAVIATEKILRLTANQPPLHYLVADAGGNAATIEFLNGKMVVHKGKELPFPVLTNSTYDESIQQTKDANDSRSFSDNSIDRFAKACSMVQQFQLQNINTPIIDYAFSILNKVSQNDWTKWSIVYDITNKKINFKSHGFSTIKTISFSSFDFNCSSTSKMYNINQNQNGEVSALFKNFSINESRPILETAVQESKKEVSISNEAKEAILNYSKEMKCK